jgi:hypothetical protein
MRAFCVIQVALAVLGCHGSRMIGAPCEMDSNTRASDVCDGDAAWICSPRSSQWVLVPCRGPSGCREVPDFTCDQSRGAEGEPCYLNVGDTRVCSIDGQAVLYCSGDYLFVRDRPCANCRLDHLGQEPTCQ